jgi:hypothetical protein
MAAAWLLTLLACGGVAAGVLIGQWRTFSLHITAAGGGLLFGIALFWLVPEIALTAGWAGAICLPLTASLVLLIAERALVHTGHSPRQGVVGPILAATTLHSFLDGWSVRAVSGGAVTNVAVPLGLALHKIPEGLALGWITCKSTDSKWKAGLASSAVEWMTLLGAFVEPRVNQSATAVFGAWWTAAMLAVIAGGFLFLGFHAVLASWKNAGVVILFLATLLLAGAIRHS